MAVIILAEEGNMPPYSCQAALEIQVSHLNPTVTKV